MMQQLEQHLWRGMTENDKNGSVWSIPARPKSKRNVHIAQSPSGLSCVLFCSVLFDLLCFIFVWFVWFVLFVPSLTPLGR